MHGANTVGEILRGNAHGDIGKIRKDEKDSQMSPVDGKNDDVSQGGVARPDALVDSAEKLPGQHTVKLVNSITGDTLNLRLGQQTWVDWRKYILNCKLDLTSIVELSVCAIRMMKVTCALSKTRKIYKSI